MRFQQDWLNQPDALFDVTIQNWLKDLKGIKYKKSTRVEHVQEAVDFLHGLALLEYKEHWSHHPKFQILQKRHWDIFNREFPPRHTARVGDLKEMLEDWDIVVTKESMLRERIAFLDYLEKNQYTEEGAFLQGAEEVVQDYLFRFADDARARVGLVGEAARDWSKKWYSLDKEFWYGKTGGKKVDWTKERLYRAVTGEAYVKLGVEGSAGVSFEVKGLKGKAKVEGRGGVFGEGKFSASAGLRQGVEVSAEMAIEVGFTLKAEASLEVLDFFEVAIVGNAFAGAMASAKAGLSFTKDGMKAEFAAEAFLGAKADGQASGKLKWRSREIVYAIAKGSVSVGIGGKIDASFALSRMGMTSFNFEAEGTIGVGLGGGAEFGFNLGNLKLSGAEFIAYEIRQALVPREQRFELMTGDQANILCLQRIRNELQRYLNEVKETRTRIRNQILQEVKDPGSFGRVQVRH